MNTSETIDLLTTALSLAQGKMPNAALNKINPHFRSKYSDLAALRDATLPALSANGLAIMQFTSVDEQGNLLLHTRLAHKSGQWVEGIYPLPVALDKPQAMGSALTYARRYEWASMCGVAAEEDDDANAATDAAKSGGLKGAEPISEAQRDELIALADDVGADKIKFCKYFKVDSIAALPSSKFEQAKAALETKRPQKEAAE